jgi:chromosomal replication initiator protein
MNDEQSRVVRPNGRPVSANIIIEETCRELRIELADLPGKGRHYRVSLARGLITILLRELTALSFPEIAIRLHRPNHSSVFTAYKRVSKQLKDKAILSGLNGDFVSVADAYVRVSERIFQRQVAADKAA